jgi:hypothetical protein
VSELTTFNECDRVIRRGLSTYVEIGTALRQVRDDKLHKEMYTTFEDCCREQWGMGRTHAFYTIDAAKAFTIVNTSEAPGPQNEAQARELVPLMDDPDEMRAVWEEALEHGNPTAKTIKEIREERQRKTAEELMAAFSDTERALYAELKAGRTVVVNYHLHEHLIAWAELQDLLERIDRRSDWGNPFVLDDDGDRDTVIESYREHYLPFKPSLMSRVSTLRGKALACWCAPEPCHGDVLKDRASRRTRNGSNSPQD